MFTTKNTNHTKTGFGISESERSPTEHTEDTESRESESDKPEGSQMLITFRVFRVFRGQECSTSGFRVVRVFRGDPLRFRDQSFVYFVCFVVILSEQFPVTNPKR
jgi:hypothetical protein